MVNSLQRKSWFPTHSTLYTDTLAHSTPCTATYVLLPINSTARVGRQELEDNLAHWPDTWQACGMEQAAIALTSRINIHQGLPLWW